MEICPVGVQAEVWMDTKLIVAFRNFPNAPKNKHKAQSWHDRTRQTVTDKHSSTLLVTAFTVSSTIKAISLPKYQNTPSRYKYAQSTL